MKGIYDLATEVLVLMDQGFSIRKAIRKVMNRNGHHDDEGFAQDVMDETNKRVQEKRRRSSSAQQKPAYQMFLCLPKETPVDCEF